ncbi:MAG: polysaccharide biosynthesis C-terminal domain-containing protein [Pseudomonadota bacterium]
MASVPLFALLTYYMHLVRSFDWVGLAFTPFFITRNSVLIIGAGLVVASNSPATAAVIAVVAFVSCLVSVGSQALIFRVRLPAEIRRTVPDYRTREWVKVSFPLFLVGSSFLIIANTDILMLGGYVKPDDVGIYNAAVRTSGILNFVVIAGTARASPRYSALHAQGKHDALRALVSAVIRWVFWPSVFLAILLIFFGDFVLSLFGPTFIAGYWPLLVLVASNLVTASAGGVVHLLSMTGHQKISAVVMACSALVNIVLNALLIPRFGLMGAAVATTVSYTVNTVWLVWIARRRLGLHAFIIPFGRVK